jgi:hypothetical protein
MHKKGRGKTESLDPLTLPMTLITALDALYGHYEKTYTEWTKPESRFGRDRITRSQQPLAFFEQPMRRAAGGIVSGGRKDYAFPSGLAGLRPGRLCL